MGTHDDRSDAATHVAAVCNAPAITSTTPCSGSGSASGSCPSTAPPPGCRVLDVCCGSGASALAAAPAVGPTGRVVPIDVAERLLAVAAQKAVAAGLTNLELRCCDATRTGLPDASFDAVVCVFGVSFAADRAAFVREMWRQVAAGGSPVITTWGPGLSSLRTPCSGSRCAECGPGSTGPPTRGMTSSRPAPSSVSSATADPLVADHVLAEPDDFWRVVLGSSYRGTLEALTADEQEDVREAVVGDLPRRGVTTLTTNVVVGRGVRPS